LRAACLFFVLPSGMNAEVIAEGVVELALVHAETAVNALVLAEVEALTEISVELNALVAVEVVAQRILRRKCR